MKLLIFFLLCHAHKNVENETPAIIIKQSTPSTASVNEGELILYRRYLKEINAQPLINK